MRLLPHHRLIETDAYDMASACLSYSSAKLLPPLLHSGPAYCTVHWSLQGNCDLRCAYTGAWGYCNSAIPDIILNYSFLEHPSQSTFGFLSHRQPHDLFLVKAGQGPYQRWTSSPKLDAVFGHKSPVRFKHFRTPPSFVNPCLVDPNKIQLIKLANQHVPGL
jgi:hypothetical protein